MARCNFLCRAVLLIWIMVGNLSKISVVLVVFLPYVHGKTAMVRERDDKVTVKLTLKRI